MLGVLDSVAVDCALLVVLFTFLPGRMSFHSPDSATHFTSPLYTLLSFATSVLLQLPQTSAHKPLFVGLALPCLLAILCAACWRKMRLCRFFTHCCCLHVSLCVAKYCLITLFDFLRFFACVSLDIFSCRCLWAPVHHSEVLVEIEFLSCHLFCAAAIGLCPLTVRFVLFLFHIVGHYRWLT